MIARVLRVTGIAGLPVRLALNGYGADGLEDPCQETREFLFIGGMLHRTRQLVRGAKPPVAKFYSKASGSSFYRWMKVTWIDANGKYHREECYRSDGMTEAESALVLMRDESAVRLVREGRVS